MNIKNYLFSDYLGRVDLNLSGKNKNKSVLSISIMLLAVISLLVVFADYFDTRSKLAAMDENVINSSQVNEKPRDNVPSEEAEAVQNSVNQLSIPWGVLFSAMEASFSDQVNLISIEPDADKRLVKIVAEAPDAYVMLDYLRALSVQPQISNIHLLNQQIDENNKEQVVRFTLEGYWAGK